MPDKQKRRTLDLLKQYDAQMTQSLGKESFLDFINHVYPGYKVGPHHLKLIQIFEDIAAGKKKRVIVNIAPRHGKSELISYLAPAWFLGKYPQKKIIMGSHTADLAVNFGRRVRNLVGSEAYKGIFPQVELQSDSKSASRWGTNFNGEYFAIGVGVPLPVGARICLLLTTLILNKKPKQDGLMYFSQLGSGFRLALSNGLCPAALSSS